MNALRSGHWVVALIYPGDQWKAKDRVRLLVVSHVWCNLGGGVQEDKQQPKPTTVKHTPRGVRGLRSL